MHPGQDAVPECIGIAADHRRPDALIQRSRVCRHQPSAGNPHTSDGTRLHLRTRQQKPNGLHGLGYPHTPDIAAQQHQMRRNAGAGALFGTCRNILRQPSVAKRQQLRRSHHKALFDQLHGKILMQPRCSLPLGAVGLQSDDFPAAVAMAVNGNDPGPSFLHTVRDQHINRHPHAVHGCPLHPFPHITLALHPFQHHRRLLRGK
ncbi:hypothetical protein D3C75_787930 [compost metagenome]